MTDSDAERVAKAIANARNAVGRKLRTKIPVEVRDAAGNVERRLVTREEFDADYESDNPTMTVISTYDR